MTEETMEMKLQTYEGRECVFDVEFTILTDSLPSILELSEYLQNTRGEKLTLKHVMGGADSRGICQEWEWGGDETTDMD